MARSATFQGSFGGDPLRNMERDQARASGNRPSLRELSEMGNRPVSDSGRRTPADDWFATAQSAPHKPLEVFLAEESQPKKRSEAWMRLEALFEVKA